MFESLTTASGPFGPKRAGVLNGCLSPVELD
jgi:hypothetical protein